MSTTFYQLLKESADKYADEGAILYDTLLVSYRQLFLDSCKKAMHFRKFEGQRIALTGPASYRFIVNFFGAIMAGKDVVMLDSFLSYQEKRSLLNKVTPDYILSSTNQYILTDSFGEIIPNAANDDKEVDGTEFEGLQNEGRILFFTFGACDYSKAVVLTSSNLLKSMSLILGKIQCNKGDRLLAVLALHHVFSIVYSVLWPIKCGACICIGRGIKHIDFDTIYYNPKILPITPALLSGFIELGALNTDLSTVIVGECECKKNDIEYLENKKINVHLIYGCSAASGNVAIASKESNYKFKIFPEIKAEFTDDKELIISCDTVMEKYDNDIEATNEILKDGYLYTGDLGCINEDGCLILKGNKKNIISLPNGEKILCLEPEQYFNSNEMVIESMLTLKHNTTTVILYSNLDSFNEEQAEKLVYSYNKTKSVSRQIKRYEVVKTPFKKDLNGNLDRSLAV